MREPTGSVRFFRVVRSNPPTLRDFESAAAHGRELQNPTPERQRLWRGLSVYDSEARARRKAQRVPLLGAYIAELEIPDDLAVQYERTTSSAGHYTLWAAPETLLGLVTSVVPV